MNAKGTVQATSSKEVKTKFGAKNVYSFNVDGTWFKSGFKDPGVSRGDVVEFEYETGTYGNDINLASLKRGSKVDIATIPTPARSVAPSGGKGVFPIPPLDGQRAIVRQNALTNARELVVASRHMKTSASALEIEQMAREIVRIAPIFEAYSCGDTEREEVEAEMAQEQEKEAA